MKRIGIWAMVFCLSLGCVSSVLSNARTDDPLGVAVSPQTLLLQTPQSGTVTVHTQIPLGDVDRTSLELNGVEVIHTYADANGHLVATFDEQAIEAIVSPPGAILTLTGLYKDGSSFEGSDAVRVVDQ